MDKKPTVRTARTSRALNSTLTGRPLSTVSQSTVKDIRNKRPVMRGANLTISDTTFAAPATVTSAEKDCEFKLEYNKLLQSIFMDCAAEETEDREREEVDGMMAQLAERCERNIELLNNTHKRLNEISFLSEKQRIIELKEMDTGKFLDKLKASKAEQVLTDLTQKQQTFLDRVDTKNVDLGYNQETGHHQLLEAMTDAIDGLESIKTQSKLSPGVFKKYAMFDEGCRNLESQISELDEIKKEFDAKFTNVGEKAVISSSEDLAKFFDEQCLNEKDD